MYDPLIKHLLYFQHLPAKPLEFPFDFLKKAGCKIFLISPRRGCTWSSQRCKNIPASGPWKIWTLAPEVWRDYCWENGWVSQELLPRKLTKKNTFWPSLTNSPRRQSPLSEGTHHWGLLGRMLGATGASTKFHKAKTQMQSYGFLSLHPWKVTRPLKNDEVGRRFSFWNGPFSGEMLIFGMVVKSDIYREQLSFWREIWKDIFSWELTYLRPRRGWTWFSFSQGGIC